MHLKVDQKVMTRSLQKRKATVTSASVTVTKMEVELDVAYPTSHIQIDLQPKVNITHPL